MVQPHIRLGDLLIETKKAARGLAFLADVEDFRSAELEPGSQFVTGDAGFQARIAGAGFLMPAVHLLQEP